MKWNNLTLRIWRACASEYNWQFRHFFILGLQTWWRHQMETFSALLAICVGNSPVTGEFPTQRPVTQTFDVFFDLCMNKRLRKLSRGWWFETPWRPLWRHCNGVEIWMLLMNIFFSFSDMRSIVPEAGIKGGNRQLHPTASVGCNYLSLPLIPASDTRLLAWTLQTEDNWQFHF